MKKLVVFASIICAGILICRASLDASPGRERVVTGVVIFLSDDLIEIKRGGREMVLRTGADTAYVTRDGAPADRSALGLCQTVRARYVSEAGGYRLVRIQVLREGECYRP